MPGTDQGAPRATESEPAATAPQTAYRPSGLSARPSHDEMVAFFKDDLFAYERAGCRIVEGWEGHGVCEMLIDQGHLNAQGHVMGGAIFTLADYAFAVASVCGAGASVSLTSTIEFLRSSKGTKLIATCDVDKPGRKVGFYTTKVTDDLGKDIAKVVTTCYHPSTE